MKKIALLFFLFLFLLELLYLDYQYIDANFVNGYIDFPHQNECVRYNLSFEKATLTSNDFVKYFSDIDIIAITIDIPKLLDSKLQSKTYYFDSNTTEQNLKRILNEYTKILRKYNFMKEYYQVQYLGVKINKVFVEISEEDLKKLLTQYPSIEVELAK